MNVISKLFHVDFSHRNVFNIEDNVYKRFNTLEPRANADLKSGKLNGRNTKDQRCLNQELH